MEKLINVLGWVCMIAIVGLPVSVLVGLFVGRFIAVGQGELIKYPEDGPEGGE
ncbi:MAG: hypothetical protein JEY79_17960 [Pseudodesulfovibrio sp.]|nr:hypothetical protein [Pseudodesulfovibrio sp.]